MKNKEFINTGLTDLDGTRIYVGNKVEYYDFNGVVKFGKIPNNKTTSHVGGHLGFYIDWNDKHKSLRNDLYFFIQEKDFKVIQDYKYLDEEDIYDKAIEKFGTSNQLIVAIEELSELQKAITKILRYKNDESGKLIGDIQEEIIDVEIMIAQLKKIYSDDDFYKVMKNVKLRKLNEKIKSFEKDK